VRLIPRTQLREAAASVLVEGNLIETISTELVDAPGATVIVT